MIEEQVEGMRGEVHSIRLTGEIGADARIHERAVQSAAERLAAEASASDNRFDQIEADMKAAVAAIRSPARPERLLHPALADEPTAAPEEPQKPEPQTSYQRVMQEIEQAVTEKKP